MNRTFQTEAEAQKAIRSYFSDRAAANGKKSVPKVNISAMDCDGNLFFKTFSTVYGVAKMTMETYFVRVEIAR